MSAPSPGSGREVVVAPYQPGLPDVFRATAERRRHDHSPGLDGRCRVDGQPAGQCYDFFAAGRVLSAMAEPMAHPTSSARAGIVLVVSAVVAVVVLAAVWLLWVR
jgi:hypothetical protein